MNQATNAPNPSPTSTTSASGTPPYGGLAAPAAARKPLGLHGLHDMRARGEKIAMLTAYDATFAVAADQAGVDTLLVGDSLGMVCQGRESTVAVSLTDMAYHTACVARGLQAAQGRSWLVADLPFGSYQRSREQAIDSSIELLRAGAKMVKLEGGGWTTEIVHFLVERGVPVCAHLGLTPQTVHALGGYKVQGRGDAAAAQLKRDAHALQDAGASLLVLEMVPAALAAELTGALTRCHTIGIGAGRGTAGQVLVMHDMLGIHLTGKPPRFVHDFLAGEAGVAQAFAAYVRAVKDGTFPDDQRHAW